MGGKNKKKQNKKNEAETAAVAGDQNTFKKIGGKFKGGAMTNQDEKKVEVKKVEDSGEEETANQVVEPELTADERMKEYRDKTMAIHHSFIEKFEAEEKKIFEVPEIEEKEVLLAKREVEEMKKLDKIIKKEKNDFEDVSSAGSLNVKLVYDKLMRTLGNMRKVTKEYNKVMLESSNFKGQADEYQDQIDKNVMKKGMLSKICDTFLESNFDLYHKHEQMLDDEKKQRQEIANSFQTRMNSLSDEVKGQQTDRKKEYDENQGLRDKIHKSIEEYKEIEQNYKDKMGQYNDKISKFQEELQKQLKDGELADIMKEHEAAKKEFEGLMRKMKGTQENIQTYVAKFDDIKKDIEEGNKKFDNYKMEIESKKLTIQLLETEIQNILALGNAKEKAQGDIKGERTMIQKQIETLKNLNKALNVQLSSL